VPTKVAVNMGHSYNNRKTLMSNCRYDNKLYGLRYHGDDINLIHLVLIHRNETGEEKNRKVMSIK